MSGGGEFPRHLIIKSISVLHNGMLAFCENVTSLAFKAIAHGYRKFDWLLVMDHFSKFGI